MASRVSAAIIYADGVVAALNQKTSKVLLTFEAFGQSKLCPQELISDFVVEHDFRALDARAQCFGTAFGGCEFQIAKLVRVVVAQHTAEEFAGVEFFDSVIDVV